MAGEEILIAHADGRARAALVAVAERRGLVPSTVDNAAAARDRISGKFFAVAVIELDLTGGGVELMTFARERSPATQCVGVTDRKQFDRAVHAFHAGAVDVVLLTADATALDAALEHALARYQAERGETLRDAIRLADDLVKTIVQLGRQVYATEIDALGETKQSALAVLFIDDEPRFVKDMGEDIASLPMDAFVEMSGGGALDKIGVHSFDLVVAKEALSDLPGSLAVNAAQQRNPDCQALLYTLPGQSGRIDRVVEGRVSDTYRPFLNAKHLAERVRQIVLEEDARRRERRMLQVVGAKHGDLLRRYGEIKRRAERNG